MSFLSCIGMPAFSMILINFSWLIQSNAFWKSTKHAYIFLLTCSDRSVIILSLNIASLVHLPFRNPIWLLERCRSMIGVILALIRCSKTFDAWKIKLIFRKSQQSCAWLTSGNVMKTVWRKSSGILPDLYMLFVSLVITFIPLLPNVWRNSAGMLPAPVALFLVSFWITSFEHNFGKYCPILIILSLLQTEINYDKVYHKIYHHTVTLLVHYLVKWTRMYWPTLLALFRN